MPPRYQHMQRDVGRRAPVVLSEPASRVASHPLHLASRIPHFLGGVGVGVDIESDSQAGAGQGRAWGNTNLKPPSHCTGTQLSNTTDEVDSHSHSHATTTTAATTWPRQLRTCCPLISTSTTSTIPSQPPKLARTESRPPVPQLGFAPMRNCRSRNEGEPKATNPSDSSSMACS